MTRLTKLTELLLERNRLRGYVPTSPEDLRKNVHLLEAKGKMDLIAVGEDCEEVRSVMCNMLYCNPSPDPNPNSIVGAY